MLRISIIDDTGETIRVSAEGSLVGPWVEELRRLSDELLSHDKTITLDLQKVWFVDQMGVALLRDLAMKSVTHINSSPFINQQLKEPVL